MKKVQKLCEELLDSLHEKPKLSSSDMRLIDLKDLINSMTKVNLAAEKIVGSYLKGKDISFRELQDALISLKTISHLIKIANYKGPKP